MSDLLSFGGAREDAGDPDLVFRHQLVIQKSFMVLGLLENMVVFSVGQPGSSTLELPSSLRARQQEDRVRVAAQLPGTYYLFL